MQYRIIYSLQIELPPGSGGELRQLIVPLRPDGTATNIQPVPPKNRTIDLRDGDQFEFQGKREKVAGIQAYRDSMTDQMPPPHREGYVCQLPDSGHRGAIDP